jgi:hypothetical protein
MFDLDGCGDSTINGNVFVSAWVSNDPAIITNSGPLGYHGNQSNQCVFANCGNTYTVPGVGHRMIFDGNEVYAAGAGAFRLAGVQYSKVIDNLIYCDGSCSGVPIQLINLAAPNHCTFNTVDSNQISWTNQTVWGIQEIPNVENFTASDNNMIGINNQFVGGVGRFGKDPNSGSTVGMICLSSRNLPDHGVAQGVVETQLFTDGSNMSNCSFQIYANAVPGVGQAAQGALLAQLSPTEAYFPMTVAAVCAAGNTQPAAYFYNSNKANVLAVYPESLIANGAVSVDGNVCTVGYWVGNWTGGVVNITASVWSDLVNARNTIQINGSTVIDYQRNVYSASYSIGPYGASNVVIDGNRNHFGASYSAGGYVVIDANRNLTNINTINSGSITCAGLNSTTSISISGSGGFYSGSGGIQCQGPLVSSGSIQTSSGVGIQTGSMIVSPGGITCAGLTSTTGITVTGPNTIQAGSGGITNAGPLQFSGHFIPPVLYAPPPYYAPNGQPGFTTAPSYNKWIEVYNTGGGLVGIIPVF